MLPSSVTYVRDCEMSKGSSSAIISAFCCGVISGTFGLACCCGLEWLAAILELPTVNALLVSSPCIMVKPLVLFYPSLSLLLLRNGVFCIAPVHADPLGDYGRIGSALSVDALGDLRRRAVTGSTGVQPTRGGRCSFQRLSHRT
jgi:hypothetical protein